MQSEELKPCPFCGGPASIEQYGDRSQSTIYNCDNCSCSLETGEEFNHGAQWNCRAEAALSAAEPVAWQWEDTSNGQGYDTKFSEYPPAPSHYISGEITPLYSAPPAPSVAVKALEWEKIGERMFVAAPPLGVNYQIQEFGSWTDNPFQLVVREADDGNTKVSFYLTLAEAKTAAQADYEDRILSALSAQVQDVAGWQLVPKEPTEDMLASVVSRLDVSVFRDMAAKIYRVMLAAAPAKQEGT